LTPEAFTTEPFEGRCPQNCDALMLSLSLAYRLDPDRVVTVKLLAENCQSTYRQGLINRDVS
ncbi:MAG: hypothetical protein AAF722_17960, partial [Cyanobacteria bacterium P01_C01_bin.70]